MKTKFSLLFSAALLVFGISCSTGNHLSSSNPEIQKEAMILSAPSEMNTFKINDILSIGVQNNSKNEIILPPGLGLTLSAMNGNNWISINNSLNSTSVNSILSPKSQKDNSFIMIPLVPEVPLGNSVIVRITIAGIDQVTNLKVQASLDVTLYP